MATTTSDLFNQFFGNGTQTYNWDGNEVARSFPQLPDPIPIPDLSQFLSPFAQTTTATEQAIDTSATAQRVRRLLKLYREMDTP